MANLKAGAVPLNSENFAADLERKQNQRMLTAVGISAVVNLIFLIGAAKGMEEKPLPLESENPAMVILWSPSPAPAETPAAAVTPAPTPTPATRIARNQDRPRTRRTQPKQTPKPRILVAKTFPTVRPVVRPTPPPPPDETNPKPQETPPPTKAVETSVASQEKAQNQNARQGRSEETRAANRNTNADLATNPSDSSTAPREGNDGAIGRLGGGSSSAAGGGSSSAGSTRTGIAGGSNAPGIAGLSGVTRNTGSLNGANGSIAGPKLSASSGPTLGAAAGPAGARNTVLMAEVGGTAEGEFTVAQGTGLKPGQIVSRQGAVSGGAPGVQSTATLAPRIAGGGIGGGAGGAESLGATYRPSTGPGGGGRGPTGFNGIKGPGASGGDGALGGAANGDPGGIAASGRGGGNGTGNGSRNARTSGVGGTGAGNGIGGNARGGNSGNGIAGNGGNGSGRGIGNGNGPGKGEGGPTGSANGIALGTGSGKNPGVLGVKGGAGTGADVNSKGTGTVGSIGRGDVTIRGGGGDGADIKTSKIGVQEGKTGNSDVVVKNDGDKPNRPTTETKAGGLSDKIDTSSRIEAKTEARAVSRPKPIITEEMLADNPKRVRVRFNISVNGSSTCSLVSSSGNADVDAAVLKACRGYRWTPATADGKPVATSQEVSFDPKDFR